VRAVTWYDGIPKTGLMGKREEVRLSDHLSTVLEAAMRRLTCCRVKDLIYLRCVGEMLAAVFRRSRMCEKAPLLLGLRDLCNYSLFAKVVFSAYSI
jgi:hypothetical protein